MHQQYAGKGLAVITVSIDPLYESDGKRVDPKEASALRADIEKFLVRQKAGFTNLWLDEPDAVWAKKFNIDGPPSLFVFDRRGKWVQFKVEGAKDIDHGEVEKLIVKLLAE
jgi:hypothetical protein